MKIIADFLDVSPAQLGDDLFKRLQDLVPESLHSGTQGPLLRLRILVSDPRFQKVRQLLDEAGFTPWQSRPKPRGPQSPKEHWLVFLKKYETEDYEAAELLIPKPPYEARFPGFRKDASGQLCIEADERANQIAMTAPITAKAGSNTELIVTTAIKTALEAANFQRLVFRTVPLLKYPDKSVPWPDESRWKLISDLILPPAIPNPPRKWDDPRPEDIRFRRHDIEKVQRFDFAHINEASGGRGALVASKRFYEFCKTQNIGMEWTPVYVDD